MKLSAPTLAVLLTLTPGSLGGTSGARAETPPYAEAPCHGNASAGAPEHGAPGGHESAPRLTELDVRYTDQEGESGRLADLFDRPVLITFFYSRCQNSKKCPMTVSRLASLQRSLREAGLEERARLLAVTFEPQVDTPERLKRYVGNRGLEFGATALALRLEGDRQQEVVDALGAPVAYNAGWVNGHGVELSLLDASGALVAKYHALEWRNPRVLEDLRRLLDGDGIASAVSP